MKALSLHIQGIVQGVGFRPFVFNLATSMGLAGWVLNSSDGVFCLVQGDPEVVDAFPSAVREMAPPMARIESLTAEEVEPEALAGFEIRESRAVDGAMTLVSPDIATCPDCLRELADPNDRRFGYPFINCTNCGPRFTIIEDVPYDRATTTMRDFPMCPECAAEYADPSDRRFHAQPDACFVCGPRLYLMPSPAASADSVFGMELPEDWRWSPEREEVPRPHRQREAERARSAAIVRAAASLLSSGAILAVKGLGGFHLACDATDERAVSRLRERKNRWGKPLAIMVPDLDSVDAFCDVGDAERELLAGAVRPIVLVRLRRDADNPIAPSVAAGLAEMGVMLPYTPLHHLLLAEVRRPLVMTSGNLSDEPIATGNAEALARLSSIADAFLLHDRHIHSRYDDSVIRVVGGMTEPVRRARGYAPHPIALPFETDVAILATGPEQKNTFTLATDSHAFVSQHIGDMENAETMEHFERTLALYRRLFRVEPRLVAHDLHPEYLSTKFAHTLDLPKIGVQHHHAHIASVTAEHAIAEPVVGVAFDGTGYGTDATIWGGEVLVADWAGFERAAHLVCVPMPGGVAAIKRPARMALGSLAALGLLEHPGAAPLRARLAEDEERVLLRMIDRGVNCPLTSSMGRLFDTVAAIAGVRDDALYEGQAAIELEALANPTAKGAYAFAIRDSGGVILLDQRPVLKAVLDDVEAAVPAGTISTRFHRAVIGVIVDAVVAIAPKVGTRRAALGGGVFMNRLVLGGTVKALEDAGFAPLTHRMLPVNDAAVSFGQVVVAWANRHEV